MHMFHYYNQYSNNMQNLITLLTQKTNLKKEYIQNILKLLDEGSTIPFIARYRKELTGGADDEVLREFETIYLSSKKLLERTLKEFDKFNQNIYA